jgi:UTP--glucose-1-phosphate uridylyltransferase
MRVEKGVILAAGFGTRLLPASKAVPKEMLPLLDRPIIQYIVEEAAAAGITQLVVVVSGGKEAIASHFSPSPQLEEALAARGEGAMLEEVRRLSSLASLAFVYQHERLGTGHALLQARHLLGQGPFALFYPDDIMLGDTPAIGHVAEAYERYGRSILGVCFVPPKDAHRYGLISGTPLGDGLYRVAATVEKPPPGEAPSNLALVGRMILTPEVFSYLDETPPGRDGEIWLTDALGLLCARSEVYACVLPHRWLDVGNPLGLLRASLVLACRAPRWRAECQQMLQELTWEVGPSS